MPVNRNGGTGSEPALPAARRGARRLERIADIVGPVCALLCIVLGALQFGQGHGIVILTLGCVMTVFWLLMIPSARCSGKR